MEMGKEIRAFLEKGRRGTQRHPFSVGWWAPGSTGWGQHRSAGGGQHRAAQETERLEKLDSEGVLLLPAASFYWSKSCEGS